MRKKSDCRSKRFRVRTYPDIVVLKSIYDENFCRKFYNRSWYFALSLPMQWKWNMGFTTSCQNNYIYNWSGLIVGYSILSHVLGTYPVGMVVIVTFLPYVPDIWQDWIKFTVHKETIISYLHLHGIQCNRKRAINRRMLARMRHASKRKPQVQAVENREQRTYIM